MLANILMAKSEFERARDLLAPIPMDTALGMYATYNMGVAHIRANQPEEGIRLLTCPFLTAARERPSVVCAMHQGLVDALAEQGAILHPFAEPGACVLSLRGGS